MYTTLLAVINGKVGASKQVAHVRKKSVNLGALMLYIVQL